MTGHLVAWSIAHRWWVIGGWALLLVCGSVVSLRLKLDAMPDLTNNQVQILTRAAGLTPEEVERRVTRPLELALGGLPGLLTHRSTSRYGLSGIVAVFEDDVDPYRVRQMVQERLLGAELPSGIGPAELGPMSGGLGEIFQFTVSSEQRSPTELFEWVQLKVAPELRRVPGIVEVNTWGGAQRTIDVMLDPLRLSQRELSVEVVQDALSSSVASAPGASLEAHNKQTLLRASFLPSDPHALGALMLSAEVRLSDVASLRLGTQPRLGAATRQGAGETVYVMLQMLRGANAREVMDSVHQAMPAVQALLPNDVRIDVVYDRSVLVNRTLQTMMKNLLEGGVLVIAVLFLLLGSLRAGLIVAAVIPLAMVGATTVMTLMGLPGNLMSLGAIDFGLIVDGAVVMVEGVFHTTAGVDRQQSFRTRASAAAEHLAVPVLFSVLVILIVYVPILTLTGVDGHMFRPMALTVVFALSIALFASLTFVPAAVCSWLDYSDVPQKEPLLIRAVRRVYPSMLRAAQANRVVVVTTFILLLSLGGVLMGRAGSELAPQLDEGDFVIQTTRASDVSLSGAVAEGLRFERAILQAIPEATSVSSRIGSPAVATDMMGYEQADVFVSLKPRGEWRPGKTSTGLIADITASIAQEAPGAESSFTQPIQMRFNELLGGAPMDVVVSVYGDDLMELRVASEAVRRSLAPVEGVADSKVLSPPDVPLLDVRPDPLTLSQFGLRPSHVLQAVQALRGGVHVADTYDGPLRVPVMLRIDASLDPSSLRALPLASPKGLLALDRVAHISHLQTTSMVQHDDGKRRVLVGFNVRGRDLQSVVDEAQAKVTREVMLGHGVSLHWGGQLEVLNAAQQRMKLVVPLALVAVLGLLFIAFRQWRPVLIIATQVPFASVGGIVALTLRGMPLSIAAIVGFVALSGVAVMNGVVLLNETLLNQANGLSPQEAVRAAAISRARPVLMTALVAMLGFVPMMLSQGVGAEVQRPLATVVVAGLLTSTFLTLLILPVIYPLTYPRWSTLGPARSTDVV